MVVALLPLLFAAVRVRPPGPVHADWVDAGAASPHANITFALALRERNLDALERIALDVSSPQSERYGKFLSQRELDELTAPAPADISALEAWLKASPCTITTDERRRLYRATCAVSDASNLLSTSFRRHVHRESGQHTVRAADFSLPHDVAKAVSAVFGLHGVPLPRRLPSAIAGRVGGGVGGGGSRTLPVAVTPSVIADVYHVSGVHVRRDPLYRNRQAVAEFQGQTMNHTDLRLFFEKFVPSFLSGRDDRVERFYGDPGDAASETEASLDVQFMMGVAPGVKTDFYFYKGNDFCADLKNWTGTILAQVHPPLVHSVSYGWQGDLAAIGCSALHVASIDGDLAQLAARGISIVISSGDSGSGLVEADCCHKPPLEDTRLEGPPVPFPTCGGEDCPLHTRFVTECCEASRETRAAAFNWIQPPPPKGQPKCGEPASRAYLGEELGFVSGHQLTADDCCNIAHKNGAAGYTWIRKGDPEKGAPHSLRCPMGVHCCMLLASVRGSYTNATSVAAGAISAELPRPLPGACTYLKAVTGRSQLIGAKSGGDSLAPEPQLYPSWPASSPWVTAVGATRFEAQTVGAPEMATDQFGSGGGFSSLWSRKPSASWQAGAVDTYLRQPETRAVPFPPDAAFNRSGRATPDVSALGEGFQVFVRGRVDSIGGTSASAPLFAGLLSLLNEARLQLGQPSLGFVNPLLYGRAAGAFQDVLKGTNAIGRGGRALKYGYNCTRGWDPATGLGTPRFDRLLKAALAQRAAAA